jgi:ABC-type cobalamin transport system ATPase subunit
MGVRERIALARSHDLTLGTLLERVAALHPAAPLVEEAPIEGGDDGLRLTCAEGAATVARWAGALQPRLAPGGRVVVALPNGYAMFLACLAATRAGGVAVPVNPRMRREEIDHIVADAGAAAVVRDLDMVMTVFPVLRDRRRQDAATLSGGEQQMCAIARGIMSRPALLMIDELSLGLAPRVVERLGEALLEVNRAGISILLVEQDVALAFELASRGFVLDAGRVVLRGASADLSRDPSVRAAYMGLA